jgi:hypothetical protein
MHTSLAALLVLAAYHPQEKALVDRVDLVELNHLYDERGQHLLDQLIFYDWSRHQARYEVRTWRKLTSPSQIPLRSWRDQRYHIRWYDGPAQRHVLATSFRETWTQYDPELEAREQLPVDRRKPLRIPSTKTKNLTRSSQSR